jgi:multiple sugar transport system ATP-binding protein
MFFDIRRTIGLSRVGTVGKGGPGVAEITFEDVTKVYGEDVVAVDKMNLDIPDGEFVVFVGPSGCGKSTALRMVAGLEDVTQGKLFIGDEMVNDVSPRDRDVAMVFQNYALYPHMNVRDNMAFALKLRKVDDGEIDRRVEEAAKILGLEDFLNRKPKALSGGQRQRVALGRAIVRNPNAFLMDEPLSNLDAKLRVQMRTEIAKLHNRISTTTIYVTHDQTEAMTMADRIVLLKGGVVQQVAPPQQMYDHPDSIFVAGFIGSPAMNFIQAHLEKENGGFVAVFGRTRLPIPRELQNRAENLERYVDEEVVLGIRPEHLEDAEIAETTAEATPIDVEPQVIESMGNEKYVYFELPQGGATARTQSMEEIESEIGTGGDEAGELLVARLAPETETQEGKQARLLIDATKVHLFDLETEKTIL